MNNRVRVYLLLHLLLMIYSVGAIISKYASNYSALSIQFVLLYGIGIVIMAFYAIGWQQIIKRMPLSVAYANKAVTVIWGCVWGVLIFHEHLTVGKVAGALLVLGGVALYGTADGKAGKTDE